MTASRPTPRRRIRPLMLAGGAMLAFLLLLAFCGPGDAALRLAHFHSLSKDEVIREARTYLADRARGDQRACLYVVSCTSGRARLERINDLEAWNFQSTKDDIWRRRTTGGYCPGRTANLALHLVPTPGQAPEVESISHAVWSFGNDRFIPRWGRFHGGAFSEEPWEHCTLERATILGPE